jgi:hypothetical protein
MTRVPAEGIRIRLLAMPDDPAPVPVGTLGTVVGGSDLHDFVQVWVKWDNGSNLSLSLPPDRYEVVVKREAARAVPPQSLAREGYEQAWRTKRETRR